MQLKLLGNYTIIVSVCCDDGIVYLLSINRKSREMDSEENLACLTVNDRIQEQPRKR